MITTPLLIILLIILAGFIKPLEKFKVKSSTDFLLKMSKSTCQVDLRNHYF